MQYIYEHFKPNSNPAAGIKQNPRKEALEDRQAPCTDREDTLKK